MSTDVEIRKVHEASRKFGGLGDAIFAMAISIPALFRFLLLMPQTAFHAHTAAQYRDLLQDEFDQIVADIAILVEQPGVAAWLTEFTDVLVGYLLAQGIAARGRPLLPTELHDFQGGIAAEQVAFAVKFANDLLQIPTRNFSQDYIINRSRLYSGAGRAYWFTTSEEDLPVGWVVDYAAVDDKGTCTPCLIAEENSPYLPTIGPMPGAVCLGRGRCRCVRNPRVDQVAFEQFLAQRFPIEIM